MRKIKPLTTNELPDENDKSVIRISSRAQANGLKIRPFRFLEKNSDQNSDQFLARKNITYKPPKLRKGKTRWWIEYWYRVPVTLKHLYPNKKWEKFRVFQDINRFKSDEYAEALLDSIKEQLKNGFNPFEYEREEMDKIKAGIVPRKQWTAIQAIYYFIQAWEDRGNEKQTTAVYKRVVDLLAGWLTARSLQNEPAVSITRKHIELCLQEKSAAEAWSNRTYNNTLTRLATCFNFLRDEKIITDSPCKGILKKKAKSKKHRYYDPENFAKIQKIMQEHDPLLYFAARIVYYLCIRSNRELKYFQVGNVFPDRRQALIQAEQAKTDADRFIPIPDELLPELVAIKAKYPAEYYVVGASHKNKFVAKNIPCATPFGNNFLSARFAKIRKLAGLSEDFTIFSLRHTRAIHLKQDGASDQDIMQIMGHTDFHTTSQYLRDIGLTVDVEKISRISRKF